MSKVASAIGQIAAVVAVAASIALILVPGGQVFGVALLTIAAAASAVSAVSMAIAQATAKPPDMRGSVSQVIVGKNLPHPLILGRTLAGGMLVYDRGAGALNRWRFQVMVLSGAGPIESVESVNADYVPITLSGTGAALGWYNGFLDVETKLGARPETAHASTVTLMPDWDANNRLSGYASYRIKAKFDVDGKRFASGMPQWGVVAKGVKIYDPRKDSTYPGGSGGHRWDDEATFEWSDNPALHALTYARGRFIEKDAAGVPLANPVKIAGCGFGKEAIVVAQFVELANICDANDWTVGGTIYEGPGLSKWDNIKRILQAAAAEPVWTGGQLGLKISAPKVSLVTIGLPDLADGEIAVQAMKSYRDKVNTVVPRVRLESQRWEYTQLEGVSSEVYLAEDGETKIKEVQYDLVQDKDQGVQLAAYELENSRELGPVTIPVKPHLMLCHPGEAVTLNLEEGGLTNRLMVITGRQVDPQTGAVLLTLESETTAKHEFALGRTTVAPPTPTLFTPEQLDTNASDGAVTTADIALLIANSGPRNLTLTIDTAGVVTVSNHERVYSGKVVSVAGATVTPSPATVADDLVGVYYDDPERVGGTVTYQYSVIAGGAGEIDYLYASSENPYRHFVALLPVPATGTVSGGSGVGPGTGGTGAGVGGGGNRPDSVLV